MNINNLEINLKNKFNDDDLVNDSIIKIYDILGDNFELNKIDTIDTSHNDQIKNNKILNFRFVNKSEFFNSEKSEFINKKIEMLKNNGYSEVTDIKISGVGRFVRIYLKSIEDYENEKIILLKEFMEKINVIDEKIKMLKK